MDDLLNASISTKRSSWNEPEFRQAIGRIPAQSAMTFTSL
jgi:hypothetical protein